MKIQLDLPENINKALKIYKIRNNKDTMGDCVVEILDKFFREQSKK